MSGSTPGFAKPLGGRTGKDDPLQSAAHPGQVRTRTGDLGRFNDLEIILSIYIYIYIKV